jgi:hypothetical protein
MVSSMLLSVPGLVLAPRTLSGEIAPEADCGSTRLPRGCLVSSYACKREAAGNGAGIDSVDRLRAIDLGLPEGDSGKWTEETAQGVKGAKGAVTAFRGRRNAQDSYTRSLPACSPVPTANILEGRGQEQFRGR